eukprot:3260851-Rhodomonas_salina.8
MGSGGLCQCRASDRARAGSYGALGLLLEGGHNALVRVLLPAVAAVHLVQCNLPESMMMVKTMIGMACRRGETKRSEEKTEERGDVAEKTEGA